jgi:hypothetical protein
MNNLCCVKCAWIGKQSETVNEIPYWGERVCLDLCPNCASSVVNLANKKIISFAMKKRLEAISLLRESSPEAINENMEIIAMTFVCNKVFEHYAKPLITHSDIEAIEKKICHEDLMDYQEKFSHECALFALSFV